MPPASYFRGSRRVAREATFDPLRGAFIVLARPNDPEPKLQERRRGLGGSHWKEPGQVKALLVRGSWYTCSREHIEQLDNNRFSYCSSEGPVFSSKACFDDAPITPPLAVVLLPFPVRKQPPSQAAEGPEAEGAGGNSN